MTEFGRTKLKFFKRFLKLKHGVPSHDTFSTVLRIIDPKALDAAFGSLTATLLAAFADGGVEYGFQTLFGDIEAILERVDAVSQVTVARHQLLDPLQHRIIAA